MGDDRKLYQSVPLSMVDVYKTEVLTKATLLLPNQTECEFLTGTKITDEKSAFTAIQLLHDTYNIQSVIISSISLESDKLLVVGSQQLSNGSNIENKNEQGHKHMYQRFKAIIQRVPSYFSGTGDLFSALILGWTSRGKPLKDAAKLTLKSLQGVLRYTLENKLKEKNKAGDGTDETEAMKTHEIKLIQCYEFIVNPQEEDNFVFESWTDVVNAC